MPGLRELQGLFWRSLADEPGRSVTARGLAAVIEPSPRLAPAGRLQIYADAYFWRLHDVLREDFPRVAALLGADGFESLVRDYLKRHPSEHPSVRHLGRHLADFLERRPDRPPYLADLARLEWARGEVFDAPDAPRATAAALPAIRPEDWPRLYFIPSPALRIIRARWPVHELWAGADSAGLTPARTLLRVWRGDDDRVFHAVIDPRAADALGWLMAGAPFVVACGAFSDLPGAEGAHQATALLARWLEDGIIAQVR